MLDFFTDPYPNELLYSAVSRYHYYIGNCNYRDTNYEIYGKRRPISNMYFGVYLEHLVKELGGTYNEKELIQNHTIFPFYQPFLNEKNCIDTINGMKKGNSNFLRFNLFSSRVCVKNQLYFCSKCAREDIEKYGEAYFHREHQLEGVLICPKHKLFLKPYNDEKIWKNINDFVRFDERNDDLKDEFIIKDTMYDMLCEISKLSYELFVSNISNLNKDKLCKYYKNDLYEKGFVSHNGMINQIRLKKEMVEYYGVELLNKLESNINITEKYNWINYIFLENSRFVHPIRHLLLIKFLGKNIESIINDIDKRYNPFGDGPWPCMNKLCTNYKKDVITDNIIRTKCNGKKTIGIFECSDCGFKYTRVLDDDKDKYKIDRILDYGLIWTNILKEYISNADLNITEISNKMQCSRETIDYRIKKIGIQDFKKTNAVNNKNNLLFEYKKCLLDIIYINPNITRSELKKNNLKEYTYVKRHDIDWFNQNLPASQVIRTADENKLEVYKTQCIKLIHDKPDISKTELASALRWKYSYIIENDYEWLEKNIKIYKTNKEGIQYIDWRKRDIELVNIAKDKYIEICQRDEVTKISIALLNREISDIPVNSYSLERMPKSKIYIESILDNTQSYRMKCYKKYIDDKLKKDENITIRRLAEKFVNIYKQNELVVKELEEYIELRRKSEKIG